MTDDEFLGVVEGASFRTQAEVQLLEPLPFHGGVFDGVRDVVVDHPLGNNLRRTVPV